MIIDCHVHLNNYHEQVETSLDQSLENLQRAMQQAGVGYSLVLTSYLVSAHRPSTAQVVKLVICHLGNPWLVDCMEVVYKNPNVYADFSGLILGEFTEAFEDYMEQQIAEVILYAGEPRKFLYGSDWPICSMKSYVEFVQQLKMSDADLSTIMYANARALFKLPLPPLPAVTPLPAPGA
jgi:hypothetical protein